MIPTILNPSQEADQRPENKVDGTDTVKAIGKLAGHIFQVFPNKNHQLQNFGTPTPKK